MRSNSYEELYIGLLSGLLCVAPVIAQNRLAEPSRVQLEWQRMETTAFVHFSVNTYTDMEWGYGNESPWYSTQKIELTLMGTYL